MKSKSKILMLVIILVLVISSLTGCKSKSDDTGAGTDGTNGTKMIRIINEEDPDTGDPQKITSTYLIALNVFDCLVDAETVGDGSQRLS